jgi:hypothetical protein
MSSLLLSSLSTTELSAANRHVTSLLYILSPVFLSTSPALTQTDTKNNNSPTLTGETKQQAPLLLDASLFIFCLFFNAPLAWTTKFVATSRLEQQATCDRATPYFKLLGVQFSRNFYEFFESKLTIQ